MKYFFIVHTDEHSVFKDFVRKKPGSLNISFIDILNQQEKYLLYGENKSNSVLECELFNKIYDSIANLHNEKYKCILYFIDTLDSIILSNFIETVNGYNKKLDIDVEIKICNLDQSNEYHDKCLETIKNQKNIDSINKEFIQKMF